MSPPSPVDSEAAGGAPGPGSSALSPAPGLGARSLRAASIHRRRLESCRRSDPASGSAMTLPGHPPYSRSIRCKLITNTETGVGGPGWPPRPSWRARWSRRWRRPSPRTSCPSSYDQVSPVLLGKEIVPGDDGQGQGRQGSGHGPAEEAPGRALRPDAAARPQGEDDARQADPGRPDREAARGHDLGAAGRDVARRDPRQGRCSPRASCRCRTPSTRSAAWSSRRWRSSSCRGWSASTSTSTCPSTSCPSSRRPSS